MSRRSSSRNGKAGGLVLALPKGRILVEALPVLRAAGIEVDSDLADEKSRKLSFSTNLPELSVSELAQAVKRTMETNFDRVRVRGELGRVMIAKSGHLYVDLKDADASISTVMWRSNVQMLNFKPAKRLAAARRLQRA